ncbi:hypothetical protein WDU94_002755 [Cyamophila willieti]
MKKDESYIKEVEKTIKAKWSEQAYNGTKLKRGKLFMDDTVKNTLIIKARSEEKSVLLDVAKSKYSDLDILLGEKDERVQFLESMTRTSKTTETARKVFLIQADTDEEVIQGLLTVKVQTNGKLSVAATEKHNCVKTRKLLEIAFYQSETEIEFYVPGRSMRNDEKERKTVININIDQRDGQSSEEVLKNMKSKIQVENMGVHIKNIKPLGNGNAQVIVLEKAAGGIDELCGQINNSAVTGITSAKVQKGKEKTIRIRNIDMTTSAEEVMKTIEEYLELENTKPHDIRVKSLKPNYRKDAQTAIVGLNVTAFNKVLDRKKIRIGWIECHIEELVDPTRCYKCFRHGHYAKDCQMTPFSKNACLRCNQEGHMAKDCTNEPVCRDCQTVGHQTGSMKCETFRDLIRRETKTRPSTREVLKLAVTTDPEYCLEVYNKLLLAGKFPDEWKLARLVLLEKEKKPGSTERSYRILCLLSVLGKLFEHMIKVRMEAEQNRQNIPAGNQYGFKQGKSTVHAMTHVKKIVEESRKKRKKCAMVAVDVKNAFNSVFWKGILQELKGKISPYLLRVICDYLKNRVLQITETFSIQLTSSVPQGSKLGPLLWNVYYNPVLGLNMPADTHMVAYADDLLVIVSGKKLDNVEENANTALSLFNTWMEEKRLALAPHKTEVVVLSGHKSNTTIRVTVKETAITSKSSTKYLGVVFDRNMRMASHITYVVEKAEKTAAALGRLMPNIGGPANGKRQILAPSAFKDVAMNKFQHLSSTLWNILQCVKIEIEPISSCQ